MRRKNLRAVGTMPGSYKSHGSPRPGATLEPLEGRLLLAATPIYRINAGGPVLTSSPDWLADSTQSPSQYSNASQTGNSVYSTATAIDMSHASIPAGTPMSLFQTERWDGAGGAELQYAFPVAGGQYTVRLYFAEIYSGAQTVGARKFDVSIEGQTVLNDYDVFADVGGNKGVVKTFNVTSDSTLNINFAHVVENPAIKGIEILQEGGVTPVGFGKGTLAGVALTNPTSLQWGPDGKLYVAQQDGTIKVLTVARNSANNYTVTNTQTITLIKSIPNHNDDGTLNTSVNTRMVTGLLVTGTAANPVIYVTSSDPRIGGGGTAEDTNLDTNSGIISRLTWNGSSWTKLDLVRGLPRSEENHAQNGMALDAVNSILYVTSGGNTNMGAPSNNFAFLPEYALSTAILSVNLGEIGNTTYDLPTLNDETRAGTTDANDPFGGNDGKNQAKLVPGGPVQVYSSGYRNPYDVVIAQSGKMYTIDNGANAGWGDVPIGSGGSATNQVHEPGITTKDNLHVVTAGFYAGHPNPTRANPGNTFNASDPQSPVTSGNPAEGTFLTPGVNDGAMALFDASTNGLVEYTASNFGGQMKGNLLTTSFDNKLYRVQLNADGTGVTSKTAIFSTVGAAPLDVTAIGDVGTFPGTVWVCDWQTGKVYVYEPNDFGGGGGGGTGADDPNLDEDFDGYDNHDEIVNGTSPLSAADVPPDWDSDFESNKLDPNDDNDVYNDAVDPFAIDASNGKGTFLPVSYTWDNDAPKPGGILGMGFTGLMSNGSADYESLYSSSGVTAGGAAGVFTIDEIGEGTARGITNTQTQAFQFGINVGPSSAPFIIQTLVLAPFAGMTPQTGQEMGVFFGTGDQDNYVQLVIDAGGITLIKEVSGVVTVGSNEALTLPGYNAIDLFLTVDPAAATVQPGFQLTQNGVKGSYFNLGAPVSIPASWFSGATAPAVGLIGTSAGAAPTFPATYDFVKVTSTAPTSQTPFGGTPISLPGLIQAENFDNGGAGVAYSDTETANLGNSYRTGEGVDIEATTDTGGGYNVGWAKAGEWVEYTVNVPASGNYNIGVRVANVAAGGKFHLELDGAGLTGSLNVPNTGGWQKWQTVTASNVPMSAGQHVLRLAMDTEASSAFVGNFNWIQVTAVPQAGLAVTSFTLINADTDQPIATFDPLSGGATIDLAALPTKNLNIRANSSGSVGSIKFALDGNGNYRTESSAPFALAGDVSGNYNPWTPSVGSHTLSATPYSGAGATGTAGTPLTITFNVVNNQQVTGPQALVQINPSGGINASTYTAGSFKITNQSTGGQKINSITIDLRTSILMDLVFDPNGQGGDTVAKAFTVDSGASTTGYVSHSLTVPHDGGYDVLTVNFNGFDPGETFTFSIDQDPTSIKGVAAPGPNESGSVSGLEQIGATVSVNFNNGASLSGRTYRMPGSLSGSQVTLKSGLPAAPGIQVLGIGSTPATVSSANQTVRISGPVGSQVSLVVLEGGLFTSGLPGGGFDIDAYEANSALGVVEYSATIGSLEYVDIPIVLAKSNTSGGINHLIAVVKDSSGATGLTSTKAILKL